MTDMGPREFWTPGKVLPESVTDQLREGPTALKHHHVVGMALFTGQGHAGVLWSQYNGVEYVVWSVDVYGNPTVLAIRKDEQEARADFAERVTELLAPDDDTDG